MFTLLMSTSCTNSIVKLPAETCPDDIIENCYYVEMTSSIANKINSKSTVGEVLQSIEKAQAWCTQACDEDTFETFDENYCVCHISRNDSNKSVQQDLIIVESENLLNESNQMEPIVNESVHIINYSNQSEHVEEITPSRAFDEGYLTRSEYPEFDLHKLEECHAMVSGNKYICLLDKAIEYKNLRICDDIYFIYGYTAYECYAEVASILEVPDFCKNLEDLQPESVDASDHCYQKVARTMNEPDICERLNSSSTMCYYYIAVNNSDIELCNQIDDPKHNVTKSDCYGRIAKNLKKHEYCKLQNKEYWADCYTYIAKTVDSRNLCEELQTINDKSQCFTSYENSKYQSSEDYLLCMTIPERYKEDCYAYYVKINKAEDFPDYICNQLINEDNKEDCMNYI